jgi:hypothetical protein
MSIPPPGHRVFAALAVLLAAATPAAAAESRVFDTLAIPAPDIETAAPADSRLTTACQTAARSYLGENQLNLGRPSHTRRAGLHIVRIDLTASGASFRAVCTRDEGGAVETVVFAAPLDETGPRVLILGGPTPEMRPRSYDPGYRIVARDPGEPELYQPYASDYGWDLPGLWYDDRHVHRRAFRHRDAIAGGNPSSIRGSRQTFIDGGIASPAISNFTGRVGRGGGGGGRGGGGRSGGGAIGR